MKARNLCSYYLFLKSFSDPLNFSPKMSIFLIFEIRIFETSQKVRKSAETGTKRHFRKNSSIFGYFGSADPKIFSHLFEHKKSGKLIKFHGPNPSCFFSYSDFKIGRLQLDPPRARKD